MMIPSLLFWIFDVFIYLFIYFGFVKLVRCKVMSVWIISIWNSLLNSLRFVGFIPVTVITYVLDRRVDKGF